MQVTTIGVDLAKNVFKVHSMCVALGGELQPLFRIMASDRTSRLTVEARSNSCPLSDEKIFSSDPEMRANPATLLRR